MAVAVDNWGIGALVAVLRPAVACSADSLGTAVMVAGSQDMVALLLAALQSAGSLDIAVAACSVDSHHRGSHRDMWGSCKDMACWPRSVHPACHHTLVGCRWICCGSRGRRQPRSRGSPRVCHRRWLLAFHGLAPSNRSRVCSRESTARLLAYHRNQRSFDR